MAISKVKGGYAVKHCHGANKGKTIKKFKTKKEAMAMHKAIMANKSKKNS